MCTAYAKIIRQKLWTSQPISMAVYKSGVKNFPAVIKTHKGEHWKSYIKSTLHWEREKRTQLTPLNTHAPLSQTLGFVFQVYVARQKKPTQNIFVHTLQNDLTSGHGRKCFAFQVKYRIFGP